MIDSIKDNLEKIQNEVVLTTGTIGKKAKKELILTFRAIVNDLDEYAKMNSLTPIDGVNADEQDFFDWLQDSGEADTTYISDYDKYFKWKKGWVNSWTGYGNEGKSSWLYFLILIKLLKEPKSKVAVFSPENYPRNKFVKDWVKTIIGKDPKYAGRLEIEKAIDLFDKRLYYVYPSKHDIDTIEEQFRNLIKLHNINITVIDPYLKITKPAGVNALDFYTHFIKKQEVFAKSYNLYHNVVYHQVTPNI